MSPQILAIAMLAALGAMSVVPFTKRPQTPDKVAPLPTQNQIHHLPLANLCLRPCALHLQHMVTLEYLRRSDGMTNPQLRLAILGQVFDVSRGRKHYGAGAGHMHARAIIAYDDVASTI